MLQSHGVTSWGNLRYVIFTPRSGSLHCSHTKRTKISSLLVDQIEKYGFMSDAKTGTANQRRRRSTEARRMGLRRELATAVRTRRRVHKRESRACRHGSARARVRCVRRACEMAHKSCGGSRSAWCSRACARRALSERAQRARRVTYRASSARSGGRCRRPLLSALPGSHTLRRPPSRCSSRGSRRSRRQSLWHATDGVWPGRDG